MHVPMRINQNFKLHILHIHYANLPYYHNILNQVASLISQLHAVLTNLHRDESSHLLSIIIRLCDILEIIDLHFTLIQDCFGRISIKLIAESVLMT